MNSDWLGKTNKLLSFFIEPITLSFRKGNYKEIILKNHADQRLIVALSFEFYFHVSTGKGKI
jgi:hypothetical protein